MTRLNDLVAQIDPLWQALKTELAAAAVSPPAAITQNVTTVQGLTAALAIGGSIQLAPGTYQGNFQITKPMTLVGTADCILVPLDLLTPTLTVQRTTDVLVKGITIQNGAPDRDCVTVGSFSATDAKDQPVNVTFDGVTLTAGAKGGHRGFALHGTNITVRKCHVMGFWEAGRDAQAVWIHNGPGPYTIEDNYLEASGENIMAGGDTVKIPGCVPSDIVIRRNICYKPDAWKTNGATVKNGIEIKNGRRVLIEGNTIDGNWRNGQDGNPFVFTVRNQNNDSAWVTIEDVILRGNVTRRCPDGFAVGILGTDDNYASGQAARILIEGNLFTDSPNGIKVGNGVLESLVIRHNTLPKVTGSFLQFYDTRQAPVRSPFTFSDNVVAQGAYGVSGTNTGVGLNTLNVYTNLVAFTGNVIEKNPERQAPLPPGNTWVDIGGLAALLDPTTLKVKTGTAGY